MAAKQKTHRKRRTGAVAADLAPEKWKELVESFQASEMTKREYAEREGLDYKAFCYQHAKWSARRGEEAPSRSFVELVVPSVSEERPRAHGAGASAQASAIRVIMGDIALEMVGELDASAFASVCKELACLR